MNELRDVGELKLNDPDLSTKNRDLARQAQRIVTKIQDDPNKLPDALLELLSTIIKPLFSGGHPQITAAGRKPAYPAPPTLPHADPISLHEEKPWKIPLTIPLLKSILRAYHSIPQPRRKEALEAQFLLLIPPILNVLDDMSATSKADGCALLHLLCDAITSADSDMLKRTGLIDVFFDAIKPNFMLLPTLTPEEESLQVLKQLYPASLALIKARFEVTSASKDTARSNKGSIHKEEDLRQSYLKDLLRHGLLAALSHLGAGTSTSYIPLTRFLVSQLSPAIDTIGLAAVIHLQTILPMLRHLLVDPFSTAAPELLLATLSAMATVIRSCAPRIRGRWWPECLRGLVGCWCNIVDDEHDAKQRASLVEVKERVIMVTQVLSRNVDTHEWSDAKQKLCEEAEDLKGLFAES